MTETFRSLRVRNYRLFASGQVVSQTGTWVQRVGQDWLVLVLSNGSGTALGLATALQFLPMLVFGMYAGVVADRYPKRRVLIITQASMAVLALALGALDVTGLIQVWHVYVIALLLGCVTAVDIPVRQAFVMEMVGREDLPNAVSLNSATFNVARIVGPAASGLLINAFGTAPTFFINAASFAAVITSLVRMREADLFLAKPIARARGQLREGIAYVRERPDLILPLAVVFFVCTFGLNFQITTALMAREVFGKGAGGFGMLATAIAVGSLIGALVAAQRKGRPRQMLVVGSALAFGALETVVGLMPTYLTFMALLVPTGFFTLTFTTAANATVQLGAAPRMRGRVMGLYVLLFSGGAPFGALFVGWLAEQLGARWSLLSGGLISIVATLTVVAIFARREPVRFSAHMRPHPHLHVVRSRAENDVLEDARSA